MEKWHGKLLSAGVDYKTRKGQTRGIATAILYLMPNAKLCPMAKLAQCGIVCLVTAGRGIMSSVQSGRLRKTRLFQADPVSFVDTLQSDIERFIRWAEKKSLVPAVRLNGTSDIPWENVRGTNGQTLMETFPNVQFYDYTKRVGRTVPGNYDLTFSYSAAADYAPYVEKAIADGLRIAAVFSGRLPSTFLGRPVINGDAHDVRFQDPVAVIVGLTAKGKAKKVSSPLVVDAAELS